MSKPSFLGPVVIDSSNDAASITIGGTPHSVTIAHGTYQNAWEVAGALRSAINDLGLLTMTRGVDVGDPVTNLNTRLRFRSTDNAWKPTTPTPLWTLLGMRRYGEPEALTYPIDVQPLGAWFPGRPYKSFTFPESEYVRAQALALGGPSRLLTFGERVSRTMTFELMPPERLFIDQWSGRYFAGEPGFWGPGSSPDDGVLVALENFVRNYAARFTLFEDEVDYNVDEPNGIGLQYFFDIDSVKVFAPKRVAVWLPRYSLELKLRRYVP